MRRALFFAFALSLGVFAPASARADDEPPKQSQLPRRQATFAWQKQEKGPTLLTASFSYKDVVDDAVAKKLSNGTANVIAMRAYLLREGEDNPIALAVQTCKITYDLWDEIFRIKVTGPGGDKDLSSMTVAGVTRLCADPQNLPIAEQPILTAGKPVFLGVIVEVNPVGKEVLEQMRRWVSRPAGSTGIAPGDALFGSFVGLFVKQIGNADKTLRFRTQAFTP